MCRPVKGTLVALRFVSMVRYPRRFGLFQTIIYSLYCPILSALFVILVASAGKSISCDMCFHLYPS